MSVSGGRSGVGDLDLELLVPPRKIPTHDPRSPTPFDKFLWESWGVMSEAVRKEAQLLHVPYLSAPFVKRMPVVVTAHDMIPWVVPGYSGSAAVRLYLALMAVSVKRARLIIADSDASRRDVIKVLKVPPSKVHNLTRCVLAIIYLRILPSTWAASTVARTCPSCCVPGGAHLTRSAQIVQSWMQVTLDFGHSILDYPSWLLVAMCRRRVGFFPMSGVRLHAWAY